MALSKSQFDMIRRGYEDRQHKNHRLFLERKELIYSRYPEYSKLEEKMGELSIARTHALIDGDTQKAAQLKQQFQQVLHTMLHQQTQKVIRLITKTLKVQSHSVCLYQQV